MWGCNSNIGQWLYISIIRSMLTYRAITWFSKDTQVTTKKTLVKLQSLACVCITAAVRTCPPRLGLTLILDLRLLQIVVEGLFHNVLHRLTRAVTGRGQIPSQRAVSSIAGLFSLFSLRTKWLKVSKRTFSQG